MGDIWKRFDCHWIESDDHIFSFDGSWSLDWLSDISWNRQRVSGSNGKPLSTVENSPGDQSRSFQPVTAIQNLLPPKEVAMATSQVFFFQYLGGAVFLAVGETIFTNSLRSSLETYAPNVSPEGIIELGASAVRSTVSNADLEGVLYAYNHAIVQIFVSLHTTRHEMPPTKFCY